MLTVKHINFQTWKRSLPLYV